MSRRVPPKSYVYIPKGSLPSLEVTRVLMYTTTGVDFCSFAGIVYNKQRTDSIYLIRDGESYMWSYYQPSSDFKQYFMHSLGGL